MSGCAVTDGDANIGLGQHQGVVDAVPDHDDRMALCPFGLHKD